jgi:hypothetical protein
MCSPFLIYSIGCDGRDCPEYDEAFAILIVNEYPTS